MIVGPFFFFLILLSGGDLLLTHGHKLRLRYQNCALGEILAVSWKTPIPSRKQALSVPSKGDRKVQLGGGLEKVSMKHIFYCNESGHQRSNPDN